QLHSRWRSQCFVLYALTVRGARFAAAPPDWTTTTTSEAPGRNGGIRASATTARPALSDEQFEQLVALIEDADSVELKLTVPEHDQQPAAAALGLDPLDG